MATQEAAQSAAAEAATNGHRSVDGEPVAAIELSGLPSQIAEACDRLAEDLTPENRPDYPPTGVVEHLDSLHGLVTSMREAGEISESVDRTLRVFIETHDYGYCIDPEFFMTYPREHLEAMQFTGVVSGLSYREATERSFALYEFLVRHGGHPAIGKVMAHGISSMPNGIRRMTEAGLSEEQSTGMALIYASHHSGYPIDFVADGLLPVELPAEFRPLLLVDDGQGGDPNKFRRKIIDRAAKLAGIPKEEARTLGALAYGIDRITPMRPPDDVIYARNGEFKIIGGEFFQKKLSLIVPGLLSKARPEDCTYESLLEAALEQTKREANEAVIAARTLQVPEMVPVLERTTARELQRAQAAHNELRFVLQDMVGKGLSGNFAGLPEDIARLRMIGRDKGSRLLLGVLESVQERVTAISDRDPEE